MAKRLTLKAVNKMLKARGAEVELVKYRDEYFYFAGAAAAKWYTGSVMVSTLNALSLEGWWQAYLECLTS